MGYDLMKVGMAGVGGIGSNVAVNLVRAGCTSLKIVDFDKVEHSNLNRQFYFVDQIGEFKVDMLQENLLKIAPGAEIEALRLRLDSGNMAETFQDCDILVEGFDEEESKKLLIEMFVGRELPIISASGIAGVSIEGIEVRQLGNCTIVGDFQTDFKAAPLYSPKISVVSAMMADLVLRKGGYHE
ncbi:MAG: sulfur carrier protein ThiS adenylyltransferase ThiF [Desulfobulbaceae bacterium]